MGYVVIKDFNKHDCLCFSTKDLGIMRSTLTFLNSVVDNSRIQVVCLSNPSMYGEYAPYNFIDDLGEFVKQALSL